MPKSRHTRKGVVRKHSTRVLYKNLRNGLRVHKTLVKKY